MTSSPLWICPRCGARLVTRNMAHSCGTFRLDELLRASEPSVRELTAQYVELLRSLGDTQVIAQKTRLVCVARVRFAAAQPRKKFLLAGFALHRWLDSPRIVKREEYGPRWRYHWLRIASEADLDAELRGWLQESHNVVGLQRDVGRANPSD
jgi:Domain of unknown function (DUF5655)